MSDIDIFYIMAATGKHYEMLEDLRFLNGNMRVFEIPPQGGLNSEPVYGERAVFFASLGHRHMAPGFIEYIHKPGYDLHEAREEVIAHATKQLGSFIEYCHLAEAPKELFKEFVGKKSRVLYVGPLDGNEIMQSY